MERQQLIAWIREEMTSTTIISSTDVIGYNEVLEPNPELNFCEFTDYPVAGQNIIVKKPIYGVVPREIPDETRALRAAEALVVLIVNDERCVYLAEELMDPERIPKFAGYWEDILLLGSSPVTRHAALKALGRTPFQLFMKRTGPIVASLKGFLEYAGKLSAAVCIYGTIIYLLWPHSRPGRWIGRVIRRILLEAERLVCG